MYPIVGVMAHVPDSWGHGQKHRGSRNRFLEPPSGRVKSRRQLPSMHENTATPNLRYHTAFWLSKTTHRLHGLKRGSVFQQDVQWF